jgi:hypothetical protein
MAGRTWIAALLCGCFLFGCGESDALIKKKLEIILTDDLRAITADMPKSSLADSVYYKLLSYKSYSEGMYSKMAVADFYFMKKVKVKITRKYRYYIGYRLWDRYSNAYQFYGDTTYGKIR